MFHVFNSLNSLAVRVPHNIPSRVSATRGPDPWLVAGGCWDWFYSKTTCFVQFASASLLVKPVVVQQFRLLGL